MSATSVVGSAKNWRGWMVAYNSRRREQEPRRERRMGIHQTAIVDRAAEIDATAEVGPYVVIEGPVHVGARTRIAPFSYLTGWTEIGEDCEIHPHAVLGHAPQDFRYKGERSYCRIGAGTVIREHASVHRGTQPESGTTIGRNCLLMVGAHVGHNCEIGDGVKLYNNSAIGGHVTIGDFAHVSAGGLIHQFCRIGAYAFVAAASRMTQDLPPFMMCAWDSTCVGYNATGLRRSGVFTPQEISEVRVAYRTLFRSRSAFQSSVEKLRSLVKHRTGQAILEFVTAPSKQGVIRGRSAKQTSDGPPPEPAKQAEPTADGAAAPAGARH